MLKVPAEASTFVKLLKKIWVGYHALELWLDETNKNSYTNKIIQNLSYAVKVYARYSFLGRIAEINREVNIAIFDGSKVIRWSMNLFNKCKYKIITYLKTNIISDSIEELNKDFICFPVRNTSIIMIGAILTNIFFSILLNKEIGLWFLVMRGLFLFIGIAGLTCKAGLQDLINTSFVLKKIYGKNSDS